MDDVIGKMREAYRKEYDKNPVFALFLTILVVCFIIFVIAAIITDANSISIVLNGNKSDVFSDYFDSIMYSSDRPYTNPIGSAIYPPLAAVFFAVLGHFLIPYANVSAGEDLSAALRDSQLGIMSYLFITLLVFYALHKVYTKLTKNMNVRTELMFLLLILLSYPFIYAVERGNIILLVIVFCFIFLMGYRSENKMIRYIAYIALGCAAGFKLYPAILGLLIVREKRYKEAAICAAIGAAFVFMPFIFTGGNIVILFEAITSYTSSPGLYGITNLSQLVFLIFRDALGMPEDTVGMISNVIVLIFTVLSFIVILFDRKMKFWKVVALLACNLILGFGVGTQYMPVYMALPILYFLISEKEMTKNNGFYVICFSMVMVLIPGFFLGVEVVSSIKTAFVFIIAFALIYEGLGRLYRERFKERDTDVELAPN